MDFSQHDDEHPDGKSPWDSSPRQSFGPGYPSQAAGSDSPDPARTGSPQTLVKDSPVSTLPDAGTKAETPSSGPSAEAAIASKNGTAVHQSAAPAYQTAPSGPATQPSAPDPAARPAPGARVASSGRGPTRNAPHYRLTAKITALERTGRKDPILRFDVHTNLPKFRTTQFRDVRRTHSEFQKLADHLISSNPEAIVPAVPPSVTAAGAGTDEDEARIKGSFQRWLNYVCSNDALARDDEMIFFVESDFGYSPVVRMKQPATGVRRKMIKQLAPPPDDTPELFEARPVVKRFYLGTMDAGQKVDKLVKARRGLGVAESDLGSKIAQMHVQETHNGLSNAYRKLGRVVQTTGDFQAAQGTAEATTLGDPLNYHSNDALIVKETLTNRHILLRDLLAAQSATRSKLSAADRLKSSSSVKRDKVDEAIQALDDARLHEHELVQKTQRVTANLLLEKRRWFERTAEDLRISIREYVLREIDAERRTLALLESIRPDIRAIDASGGLSRLGREAHPAARRASLAASQGPKGDAWSGVQRRGDALTRSVTGSSFGAVAPLPEEDSEDGTPGSATSRARSNSNVSRSMHEDDDEDRVDARNAASRLATSTF